MDIVQFHAQVDELYNQLEQQLDDYADQHDTDIDYEIHGNVLSISFENGSKIIINTQEPLLQVWMATRKQGYHFDFTNNDWICTRCGLSFAELFNQAVLDQIAE